MSDYLEWCEKIKNLPPLPSRPLDNPNQILENPNQIDHIILPDRQQVIRKEISPSRPYVPRIKLLGETAYNLFDHYFCQFQRVTPMAYAVSPTKIWRSFLPGRTGEKWRGAIYWARGHLDRADQEIVKQISASASAERIALIDMIFLCQDRSGRNWLEHNGEFWALDNSMFWPFRGRFADKETMRTGRVNHLHKPMEALVGLDRQMFRNGIFSTLCCGKALSDTLLDALSGFNWDKYLNDLSTLVGAPLDYSPEIVKDWRFLKVRERVEWFLTHKRFPTVDEAYSETWRRLSDRKYGDGPIIWKREWEIKHLETI